VSRLFPVGFGYSEEDLNQIVEEALFSLLFTSLEEIDNALLEKVRIEIPSIVRVSSVASENNKNERIFQVTCEFDGEYGTSSAHVFSYKLEHGVVHI
jgi:hypothetical protein